MHDIRAIRDNPELYEKHWAAKGSAGRVAEILDLDARLRAAQTALKNAVPQLARVYVLTWKRYWSTVRTCKIYDYANHRWMDFKGHVTAAPLFPEPAAA